MINNSNKVDAIIIHCSATREGQDIGAKEIDAMHKQRVFNGIGYHYVIRLNGKVEKGRNETAIGAHCNTKGFSKESYNRHSIGICYVGGLDKAGKAKDTRTPEQKEALIDLAVIRYPRISNFTDFAALERMEGVNIHYLTSFKKDSSYDLIIIPGSKNTIEDLRWLKKSGITDSIIEAEKMILRF